MKIETKYDPQDIVWCVVRLTRMQNDWFVAYCKIRHGIIHVSDEGRAIECWRVVWQGPTWAVWDLPISDIYPTDAAAQAECDRRNKEAGSGH